MTSSGAAKKKAAVAENYYNIMVAAAQTSSSCLNNIEQVCEKGVSWIHFLLLHVVEALSDLDELF
jgi:hypothetical protein